MNGICSTHGGDEKCVQNSGRKTLREEMTRIISEWILGKEGGWVWTGCIWLRIGTTGGLEKTVVNLRDA
jgi:hypothetical protein